MSKERKQVSYTLGELAERLGGELHGDGSVFITGVNSLEAACGTEIGFVTSKNHLEKVEASSAAAVLAGKKIEGCSGGQILVDCVEKAIIDVLNLYAPRLTVAAGIHKTAFVDESATVGSGVSVGPMACIGPGVSIGANCIIGAGCVIGEGTEIGENCLLGGNVTIYHDCSIGDNCVIQGGSTIGSTGFGYYLIDGQHRLIPHVGRVVIEDCVEVGANSCIDRGKFSDTRIGAGTKIDNLVQVAHNVVMGKCCLIAGFVGLAGSSRLGDGVVLAGQVGVKDHVQIGDGIAVGAKSGVMKNFFGKQQLFGMPAREVNEQRRIYASMAKLPGLIVKMRKMAARVEKLEASEDDKK